MNARPRVLRQFDQRCLHVHLQLLETLSHLRAGETSQYHRLKSRCNPSSASHFRHPLWDQRGRVLQVRNRNNDAMHAESFALHRQATSNKNRQPDRDREPVGLIEIRWGPLTYLLVIIRRTDRARTRLFGWLHIMVDPTTLATILATLGKRAK